MIDRAILRRAWAIAWPLMIAESLDSILWITDTFFISRLGDAAVAAVGLAGSVSWFLGIGAFMLYMGAMVIASQAYGARRYDLVGRVAGEAMTLNAALAVPVALAGVAAGRWLMRILGGEELVIELGYDYLVYRLLGLPLLYAAFTLDAVYRAVGITKPVLQATAAATALNVLLDPVLIFGLGPAPRMGVAGAGLASSIAAGLNLSILYARQGVLPAGVKPLAPSALSLEAVKIGLPALVERAAFVGGNLAYIGSVARCGTDALAAHTIGVRIESLAFLPMFSIATAGGALVGQELGAGRMGEAKRVGWEVAKGNLLFGALVGAALIAMAPYATRAFTDTARVAWLAVVYLVIAGVTEPPLGMAMSMAQAIRNAGNTLVPTLINLASLYTLRVIPAYILPAYMPQGLCVLGAWLAMGIDVTGRGAILGLVYRRWFEILARRIVQ